MGSKRKAMKLFGRLTVIDSSKDWTNTQETLLQDIMKNDA